MTAEYDTLDIVPSVVDAGGRVNIAAYRTSISTDTVHIFKLIDNPDGSQSSELIFDSNDHLTGDGSVTEGFTIESASAEDNGSYMSVYFNNAWLNDRQLISVYVSNYVSRLTVNGGETTTTTESTTTTTDTSTESTTTTTETSTESTTTTTETSTESTTTTTETSTSIPSITTTALTSQTTNSSTDIDVDDVLLGDINLDGVVSILDIIKFTKYSTSIVNFNETQRHAADCNCDNNINFDDLIILVRYITVLAAE